MAFKLDWTESLHLSSLRLDTIYIDTDLMQLRQHGPHKSPHIHPEREKLKQRLFDIEKERRTLSLKLEEKTRGLEEKLLGLVNRHEQINIWK